MTSPTMAGASCIEELYWNRRPCEPLNPRRRSMINATSQKRALKAIPKLVFGLIVFFGVAFAAPIVCGYAPPAKHMASIR
jgi:hypothetical protein